MLSHPNGVFHFLLYVLRLFNAGHVLGNRSADVGNGCFLKANLPYKRRGPHEFGGDLSCDKEDRDGLVVAIRYPRHHVVTARAGGTYSHSEAFDLGVPFSHERSTLLMHGANVFKLPRKALYEVRDSSPINEEDGINFLGKTVSQPVGYFDTSRESF